MLRILKWMTILGALVFFFGAGVYITIHFLIKYEKTVVVPDLKNKNVLDVLKILTRLDLNAKIKETRYHPQIPRDRIIFHEPEAGSRIKAGRDVYLHISRGPQTVTLPDVTGLTVTQAHNAILEKGLCIGNPSFTYTEDTVEDQIIAQNPSAGTRLEQGKCIKLLISRGIRPVVVLMPDVKGILLEEAIVRIEKSRLSVNKIFEDYQAGKTAGVVLDQTLPAGYHVLEKTGVDLVINKVKGQNKTDTDHLQISDRNILFIRHQTGYGYLNKQVRVDVEYDHSTQGIEILSHFVRPAREVWFYIPFPDKARVQVYENDTLVRIVK